MLFSTVSKPSPRSPQTLELGDGSQLDRPQKQFVIGLGLTEVLPKHSTSRSLFSHCFRFFLSFFLL